MINVIDIESSHQEKFTGDILDNQLYLKYLWGTYVKSQKLNTLARMSSFMDLPKCLVILKAYYLFTIWLLRVSLDDT